MINFSTLQGLTIPEGVVAQITDASGKVLWASKRVIEETIYLNDSDGYYYEYYCSIPDPDGISLDTGGMTITEIENDGVVEYSNLDDMLCITALAEGTAILEVDYSTSMGYDYEKGESVEGYWHQQYRLTIVVEGNPPRDEYYEYEENITLNIGETYDAPAPYPYDSPSISSYEDVENDGVVWVDTSVGDEWIRIRPLRPGTAIISFSYESHNPDGVTAYCTTTYNITVDGADYIEGTIDDGYCVVVDSYGGLKDLRIREYAVRGDDIWNCKERFFTYDGDIVQITVDNDGYVTIEGKSPGETEVFLQVECDTWDNKEEGTTTSYDIELTFTVYVTE